MTTVAAIAAKIVLFSTTVLQSRYGRNECAPDRVIRKRRNRSYCDKPENRRSEPIRRAHGTPHVAFSIIGPRARRDKLGPFHRLIPLLCSRQHIAAGERICPT